MSRRPTAPQTEPPMAGRRPGAEARAQRRLARLRRRRWGPLGRLVVTVVDGVVLAALAVVLILVLLSDRDLAAPDWLRQRIEARVNAVLAPAAASIGGLSVAFDRTGPLEVRLKNVALTDRFGARVVVVPQIAARLDRSALWQGQLRPTELALDGAVLRLRRDREGRLEFGLGEMPIPARIGSPTEAVAALQAAFARPGLAAIKRVEARQVTLDYADDRAGRAWRIEDGAITAEQSAVALVLGLSFDLPRSGPAPAGASAPDAPAAGTAEPARVSLRLVTARDHPEATLSALVRDVPARDIAAHSPALAWMEPLEARVSGTLVVGLDSEGRLGPLDGTLEIGEGQISSGVAGAEPIPFDGARTAFSYRPESRRVTFATLQVRVPDMTLEASGHVLLEGVETGWPTALTGQIRIDDLLLDPPGVFAGPVHFNGGALDVKLVPRPFRASIGQLTLTLPVPAPPAGGDAAGRLLSSPAAEGGRGAPVAAVSTGLTLSGDLRLTLSGTVEAGPEGWRAALDLSVPRLTPEALLALWPLDAVPLTRVFLNGNLLGGEARAVRAAVRLRRGAPPQIAVGFQFREAALRILPDLPPIQGGAGFGSIQDNRFDLTLEQGHLVAPGGGRVDLDGSSLTLDDMRRKPPDARLALTLAGGIVPVLEVLDRQPFAFLTKAGQRTDLADGQVQARAVLRFPMARRIAADQIGFDVTATLADVSSAVLVPGRTLEAETLAVTVVPGELAIEGKARLEGLRVEGRFVQPLGQPGAAARIDGGLQIGAAFVERFGIGLPPGTVRGEGWARFALTLPQGAPPRVLATSDLAGIALSVQPLGFALSAQGTGTLEVEARLGPVPQVDRIRLEAPGLSAEGSVRISAAGQLERAEFSRVRAGTWLDAPITLTGRGAGRAPAVTLAGGRVDLRGALAGGGGGGDAAGAPLSLALDRLVVTDGIALTGVRGDFSTARGIAGRFTASVNGRAPVTGQIAPSGGGTAVRLDSGDAGAVLAAAGLFERGRGGTLAMTLFPRGAANDYDGQLAVTAMRVRSSAGLEALLNAISVVGLLDQMSGQGLLFDQVQARFRLTPRAIEIVEASGTGPSVGITAEGVYDMARDRLDVQGVFSPSYALNSIGQIFTRRGEGLVGLTYTMTGSAKAPKVQVNPLSALTPGMFREIFRGRRPSLGNE